MSLPKDVHSGVVLLRPHRMAELLLQTRSGVKVRRGLGSHTPAAVPQSLNTVNPSNSYMGQSGAGRMPARRLKICSVLPSFIPSEMFLKQLLTLHPPLPQAAGHGSEDHGYAGPGKGRS